MNNPVREEISGLAIIKTRKVIEKIYHIIQSFSLVFIYTCAILFQRGLQELLFVRIMTNFDIIMH